MISEKGDFLSLEPSEELVRVFQRWIGALNDRGTEAAVARLSTHEGALQIGSDASEWWRGGDAVMLMRRQMEEWQDAIVRYEVEDVEAWEEGTVGWLSARLRIETPEATVNARATAVFHLERGEWRIVNSHLSLPRPNADVYGREMTVTIEQLERLVQRDLPDVPVDVSSDGTVTIMFTDIVDSTMLNARIGDQAWVELLKQHDALIAQAATSFGGRSSRPRVTAPCWHFPLPRVRLRLRRKCSAR